MSDSSRDDPSRDDPSRDDLAAEYLDLLPYPPYPVQEEALLAWYTAEQGVLVCAPTGTGKTLIAEAAMYEALRTGRRAYYTTPLIALTDQKFQELQESAVRWGFPPEEVGLVTGNRRINPDATVLVVVAEILLNRLLHPQAFAFDDVTAVVMDEFHSFNDPERGVVWELSLGLLPPHVRTLLLSATVGNAMEFQSWLQRNHNRRLELVQSTDRKVPLAFQWVGDALLSELLEQMASGDEAGRRTPALVFCFNREECWTVAEHLKGKKLVTGGQQAALADALAQSDWSEGAGPKLKQILQRGIGVHHAGLLPKYRRLVEELFQRKLLSVAVCTETLAAGINLPARSVVMPKLLKGPPGKQKVIEASNAHQMFGRAGRPQFDDRGYVFALAHEDDVKILRWKEKYDQIPEDTKDPGLRKAKKALKKKMPTRRANQQYWTEAQFEKLRTAPPSKLASRGPLPWRLLAYMLDGSADVQRIRELVGKRLQDSHQLADGQRQLDRMLLTLWNAGYVELEPPPPRRDEPADDQPAAEPPPASPPSTPPPSPPQLLAGLTGGGSDGRLGGDRPPAGKAGAERQPPAGPPAYRPLLAHATDSLDRLLALRGVNPLYGVFLANQLGIADRAERIQALESLLEMPGSVARLVRVPPQEELPPGPLATTRLDVKLLQLGLATQEQLVASEPDEDERERLFREERVWVLTVADKLKMLFDHDFPGVHGVRITPVWAVGELLEFGGRFNHYITSRGLQKQEGIIFRHVLRLILLIREFLPLYPPDVDPDEWEDEWLEISDRLVECCRQVDPSSTDRALEEAQAAEELSAHVRVL